MFVTRRLGFPGPHQWPSPTTANRKSEKARLIQARSTRSFSSTHPVPLGLNEWWSYIALSPHCHTSYRIYFRFWVKLLKLLSWWVWFFSSVTVCVFWSKGAFRYIQTYNYISVREFRLVGTLQRLFFEFLNDREKRCEKLQTILP